MGIIELVGAFILMGIFGALGIYLSNKDKI